MRTSTVPTAQGVTKLLLTKIPHYKEVILMSFECEHCGFKNNEIQSGDRIQDRGRTIELTVKNTVDLNRQVFIDSELGNDLFNGFSTEWHEVLTHRVCHWVFVHFLSLLVSFSFFVFPTPQVVVSDYATVRVPELDLEIPAQKKQGRTCCTFQSEFCCCRCCCCCRCRC